MSVPHYPNYHGFKTSNIVLLQEFLNNFWPFTVPFEFYFIFLFASLYWRVPHPHGTTGKPETWQVLQLQQEAWKGKGLTCGLATPSWKKLRQTDRRAGEENSPHSWFSPLCPHLKRKSNTGYAALLVPSPTICSICGTPLGKSYPEAASHCSSFTLVCSGQLNALFPPSPSAHHPQTIRHLLRLSLSSLGPPCPKVSGNFEINLSILQKVLLGFCLGLYWTYS